MTGSALLGIIGGLLWSAIAPQALFMVASHGVAYVVNPETSAFIAADGYFSFIAIGGGIVIGLVAYLTGVRRFGPLPAAGALIGATAAAFLADWAGSNVGLDDFRHRLAAARPGALLRQPAQLGAHGALAFWPLAAGAVVGGIELLLTMRERRQQAASAGLAGGPGTAPPASAPAASAPAAAADGFPTSGPYSDAGPHSVAGPYHLDGQQPDSRPLDSRHLDGQSFGSQPFGGQSQDGRPRDGQPLGGQSFDGQPFDGQSFDGQSFGGRAVDGQPADGQSFDSPAGWRPAGPAPDAPDS
ncbi:MAG TPA: hypothetical protein VGG35_00200 [Streptosporangiaceae bacterium]